MGFQGLSGLGSVSEPRRQNWIREEFAAWTLGRGGGGPLKNHGSS